jgi:excisionase family DNA binding protein
MSAANPAHDPSSFGQSVCVNVDLPPAAIEAIAQRAAAIVLAAQAPAGSTWLSTDEAAEHLRCPRSRVHDLTALGKLTPRRDGRRLLFRRDDLDAYLEASR